MFPKSFSSINSESEGRSPWVPIVLALLLLAWASWFLFVPVSIYEIADSARIEVAQAAHPVDAPVQGQVIGIPGLSLGRSVQKGEVLVEVDAESFRLELRELEARLGALRPQLEAIKKQQSLESLGVDAEKSRGRFAAKEARSRYREAVVLARQARQEADRSRRLQEAGSVPAAEAERRWFEAQRQRASAQAVGAELRKLGSESQTTESDRQTRMAFLEREAAQLEGQLAQESARAETLRYEIDRRKIRAPATGRVSEVAPLQVGAMLKPGDRLATIVAGDRLRVVAELHPGSAFGRVRPGQVARVELEAFPWTEYGVVTASVSSVAGEIRDGRARVELAVISDRGLPLQHGLPAQVSIEVEVATGAQLVLRAAGRSLAVVQVAEAAP